MTDQAVTATPKATRPRVFANWPSGEIRGRGSSPFAGSSPHRVGSKRTMPRLLILAVTAIGVAAAAWLVAAAHHPDRAKPAQELTVPRLRVGPDNRPVLAQPPVSCDDPEVRYHDRDDADCQ
jgi:hypothetical protein